jgi:hypothetical protein
VCLEEPKQIISNHDGGQDDEIKKEKRNEVRNLRALYFANYYYSEEIKMDDKIGTRNTHAIDKQCI